MLISFAYWNAVNFKDYSRYKIHDKKVVCHYMIRIFTDKFNEFYIFQIIIHNINKE